MSALRLVRTPRPRLCLPRLIPLLPHHRFLSTTDTQSQSPFADCHDPSSLRTAINAQIFASTNSQITEQTVLSALDACQRIVSSTNASSNKDTGPTAELFGFKEGESSMNPLRQAEAVLKNDRTPLTPEILEKYIALNSTASPSPSSTSLTPTLDLLPTYRAKNSTIPPPHLITLLLNSIPPTNLPALSSLMQETYASPTYTKHRLQTGVITLATSFASAIILSKSLAHLLAFNLSIPTPPSFITVATIGGTAFATFAGGWWVVYQAFRPSSTYLAAHPESDELTDPSRSIGMRKGLGVVGGGEVRLPEERPVGVRWRDGVGLWRRWVGKEELEVWDGVRRRLVEIDEAAGAVGEEEGEGRGEKSLRSEFKKILRGRGMALDFGWEKEASEYLR
ncbi:hypothetical protein YB2330_006612 [Saitoella coloradoensis]